ncbi:MAG: hypothetical protein ACTHK4_06235, partial [Mycobacteriales bacterium]
MPAVDTSTRGPHGGRAGFNLNFSRLTRTDLITGGCSFLVFITLFLPWFGVSGYSKSGLSTHNFLVLVILTALAILGYLFMRAGWEEPPLRIPLGHTTTLLVAGGVQLLFVLLAVADAPSYT